MMKNEPTVEGASVEPAVSVKRWYQDRVLAPVLLVTFGLDQLSKYLVRANMDLGESLPAEGFFRITYATNSGSAFGLFPNQTVLLILASAFGISFLVFFYRSHPLPGALLKLALGLQLGGAFGNLLDRVRVGHVVDFIDVGAWPIFNLADSAILVGIALLVRMIFSSMDLRRPSEKASGAAEPVEEEGAPPS